MSGVKVGDRVRATCGENVIVGTVTWLDENDLQVDTGDAFGTIGLGRPAAWSIEVIAPPIPDVVGTIVRDKDGDAWERCEGGWYSARPMLYNPYVFADLQEYAPLEVLWTPEP